MNITINTSAGHGGSACEEEANIEIDMTDVLEFIKILKSMPSFDSFGNELTLGSVNYDSHQHRLCIFMGDVSE
jgi:hypothetical protein